MKRWKKLSFLTILVCSSFSDVGTFSEIEIKQLVDELNEVLAKGRAADAAIVAEGALRQAQFDKEVEARRLLKIERMHTVIGMSFYTAVAIVIGYYLYEWIKNKKVQQGKE